MSCHSEVTIDSFYTSFLQVCKGEIHTYTFAHAEVLKGENLIFQRMRGKLFTLEGTDGSGKKNHTQRIIAKMEADGFPVKTISFPAYGTESCKGVELYLNGTFGSAEYVGPYYESGFYVFDRAKKAPQMIEHLEAGINIVTDRYNGSNLGHQGANFETDTQRQEFIDWALDLEFNKYKIPVPDATVFIHFPPFVGQQFIAQKEAAQRTYLLEGKARDILEDDVNHLKRAEAAYLYAAKMLGWIVVEAVKPELRDRQDILNDPLIAPEKKVRTLDEINVEIYDHVLNALR